MSKETISIGKLLHEDSETVVLEFPNAKVLAFYIDAGAASNLFDVSKKVTVMAFKKRGERVGKEVAAKTS